MFFSNLIFASVLKSSLFQVFLTWIGSKFAISTRIFWVYSETSLQAHHIIPASASIFSLSFIIISHFSKVCSFQVRSVNFSPHSASVTTIFHSILSASKKWIGWEVKIINKFEKSTQLFLGSCSKSISSSLSLKSDFLTSTFFNSNVRYVLVFSLSTKTFFSALFEWSKVSKIFVWLNNSKICGMLFI